jgi:hypothetical protein
MTEPTLEEETPEVSPVIAADAPPGDTYSRDQAGKLLGVSARRVSQLAAEGRLDVVQGSPLRVSAQSVHELRKARQESGRDLRAHVPPPTSEESVAAAVAAEREHLERMYTRQIEQGAAFTAAAQAERDRALADLAAERARAEREREELRADILTERTRADAERDRAEALAARKWWRRS